MTRLSSAALLLTLATATACSGGGYLAAADPAAPSLASAEGVVATDAANPLAGARRADGGGTGWNLGIAPPGSSEGGGG